MPSLFLFLCALLTLTSFIHAKGTKPANFGCYSFDKPKHIDVVIETGSKTFAGTNDAIRLLLRDSHGVLCATADLDNPGDDHERNSIDHYILCCPQDFAKANDTLSLLLLNHEQRPRSDTDDWFIERIKVHMDSRLLLEYRFHAWTNPMKVTMFGVSKVESSRSKNGIPSYAIIRL